VVKLSDEDIANFEVRRDVAMATTLAFYICGAHWRHVANMTAPSMCGADAALCEITLTTCSIICVRLLTRFTLAIKVVKIVVVVVYIVEFGSPVYKWLVQVKLENDYEIVICVAVSNLLDMDNPFLYTHLNQCSKSQNEVGR